VIPLKCNWQDAETCASALARWQAKRNRRDRHKRRSRSSRMSCGLTDCFARLRDGLGLELLDHAVQPVLVRGCYRQKLKSDARGPGPSDCGIVDYDRLDLTRDVQLHGQLHAGKGADNTVYAATFYRKVEDRACMVELIVLMHQGAGE